MNISEKIENLMPVVYVVTSGDYSEYGIVSIWSSKDAAADECELLNGEGMGNDFRVEQYNLNVSSLDGARRMVAGYKATLYPSSLSGEPTAADVEVKRYEFEGEREDWSSHIPANRYNKDFIVALAVTQEKAVELVLDRFAESKK